MKAYSNYKSLSAYLLNYCKLQVLILDQCLLQVPFWAQPEILPLPKGYSVCEIYYTNAKNHGP